jgi:hypothetical protein
VLCAAVLTACATAANGAPVSAPTQPNPTVTLNPVTTTMPPTTLPQTTTTTAPVVVPSDTPCAEWLPLAVQVGWPNDTDILQTLGRIMWRESRCQPDACSKSDSDRPCRDYGLTQGNWTAHHEWWADLGITPDEMFDPATNLRWAWLLYSGREARGQCGWQPWSKPCN